MHDSLRWKTNTKMHTVHSLRCSRGCKWCNKLARIGFSGLSPVRPPFDRTTNSLSRVTKARERLEGFECCGAPAHCVAVLAPFAPWMRESADSQFAAVLRSWRLLLVGKRKPQGHSQPFPPWELLESPPFALVDRQRQGVTDCQSLVHLRLPSVHQSFAGQKVRKAHNIAPRRTW